MNLQVLFCKLCDLSYYIESQIPREKRCLVDEVKKSMNNFIIEINVMVYFQPGE